MDCLRKTALVAGVLYLITSSARSPRSPLLDPVLHNTHFIVGAGSETQVLWGCLLDLINAIAAIGTAVVLFPVVKRQNEGVTLGFVTARLFEAAIILIGVVSLLAVVTLRQDLAGVRAPTSSSHEIGRSLVATRDWTFLLGPSLIPASARCSWAP